MGRNKKLVESLPKLIILLTIYPDFLISTKHLYEEGDKFKGSVSILHAIMVSENRG